MIAYWALFATPLLIGILSQRLSRSSISAVWFFVGLFFVVLIGLRFEVGGDWSNYLRNINRGVGLSFKQSLTTLSSDPAYALLSWVSIKTGLGIYGNNFFASVVFMTGLISFCKKQPMPWMGLLVAVPYMVVVFAMGYTRQSIAFGFELLALCALSDGRIRRFVFLILVGALFHKSAVVLLPLAALASTQRRLWSFFWVGVCAVVAATLVLGSRAEDMWDSYVASGNIQSSGGGIRVSLSAIPALLSLIFCERIFNVEAERKLWFWVSVFVLVCVPLVFIASTAVDRVALYLMPIQIVVFSRLHSIFSDAYIRALVVVSIIGFYAFVQFVWLNFANHAHAWVPYSFAPFQ